MAEIEQDNRISDLAQRLLTVLSEDGPGALQIAASSLLIADLAHVLDHLEVDDRRRLFLALPPALAAEVLEELIPEVRDELLDSTSDARLQEILETAGADDAVYFLDHLDEDRAAHLLEQLDEGLRAQLAEQFELPEDSAGHMMTRDVVTLRVFMTAAHAVETVRRRAKPYEGSLYVVNAKGRLQGVLGLRDLLVASSSSTVGAIMRPDLFKVGLGDDRRQVAELMQRYHLRSVPVVDSDDRLVGQVTWDDAVDVLEAEAEEDMLAIAGTNEDLDENATIWQRSRQRLPYLLITAVGGFVMAKLIHSNSDKLLADFPILLAFLPLVPALGGNIGIQCSTVTVRSIATGEVKADRILSRTYRELGTGVILSIVLSAVCGIGALAMIATPAAAA